MAQCAIYVNKKCDICESSLRKRYCIDCEQYFCKPCEILHLKAKSCKMHEFITLDEVNQIVKPTKCDLHNEKHTYFCETCSSVLCYKCLPTAHKKHEFVLIEDAATKRRSKLETEIKSSVDDISEVSETIKCLKNAKKQIVSQANGIQIEIEIKRKELIELVNKEANEYLETIKNRSRTQCFKIDLQIEKRNTAIEETKFAQEMIETVLAKNSPVAILQSPVCEMKNLKTFKDIPEEIDFLPLISLNSSTGLDVIVIKQMFGFSTTKTNKGIRDTFKIIQPIKPGDHVRINLHISEPCYGWGPVQRGSIGIVNKISDGDVFIDFPEYSSWKGHLTEIELSDPF